VTLTSPVPFVEHYELVEFVSGVPDLDDWLRRRLAMDRTYQGRDISRA